MILVKVSEDKKYISNRVRHSGIADKGEDILCALYLRSRNSDRVENVKRK